MVTTEKMKLIYLALVFLHPIKNVRTNGESSGEYLQKVILQLQEFNVPTPVTIHNRLSLNHGHNNAVYMDKNRQNHGLHRINMYAQRNVQKYQNQSIQHYNIFPNEKIDQHSTDLENSPHYYESRVPTVTKIQEPQVLGFTRAELAAMYKSALQKGSPISLSSLTNALSSGDVPQITKTHVEFPVRQPPYKYYFFPLKTFMSEFKKSHGYKTIPVPAFDNTEAAQTTQTQLSHPLFVAISTFVTMAIVFMMSVLFLPKLAQLDILHSRSVQDDFFYLLNIVTNAVERYNLLNNLKDYRIDSIR